MTGIPQRNYWRLGVVSFLNAKPLIAGLDADPEVELLFDVPSRLPAMLDSDAVDAALIPIIDLAANQHRWQVVSDACIGSDGETLTVRVFSRVEAKCVSRLHVDGDSHTSVVLAQVIWRELFDCTLAVEPLTGKEARSDCEAILLIGDKVVTHGERDFAHELDLGAAWKSLTNLPFVFAAWAAPRERDHGELAKKLSCARDRGVASAETIAALMAPRHDWPVDTARRYLCDRLKFTLGKSERSGMARFLELARKHALLPDGQELTFV